MKNLAVLDGAQQRFLRGDGEGLGHGDLWKKEWAGLSDKTPRNQ
jgi:hypothetical protein